jgi:aryl-alcohol dehydrogenase-like predicted oxidoreductase
MSDSAIHLPTRALGSTGLQVSCLGLGTVKFGRNQGVKYPTGFELPDDNQLRTLLDTARSVGINFIDTAPAYGTSEQRLGQLLNHRHDWVICSKTGEEFVNGQSHFDFSAQHTRLSVQRSLKRLRTDFLDVVLVHSDGKDELIIQQTDCFETLQRLKEQGLIRAFGLSGKTCAGGMLALQYSDVVMVTYNPLETKERDVIHTAHALDKGVLIKKAFNSGHGINMSPVAGESPSQNPAADSLAFVLSEPGVSSVIVGTINVQHLKNNAAAVISRI